MLVYIYIYIYAGCGVVMQGGLEVQVVCIIKDHLYSLTLSLSIHPFIGLPHFLTLALGLVWSAAVLCIPSSNLSLWPWLYPNALVTQSWCFWCTHQSMSYQKALNSEIRLYSDDSICKWLSITYLLQKSDVSVLSLIAGEGAGHQQLDLS